MPENSHIWNYLSVIEQWLFTAPAPDLTVRKIYFQFLTMFSFEVKTKKNWRNQADDALPWAQIWSGAYGGLCSKWEGTKPENPLLSIPSQA